MVNQWIKHLGRTRKQHPELKNDFKGLAAKAKETYKPQNGGCEDPTNCSEGGSRSRKKNAGSRHGKKRGGKKSRKAGMHCLLYTSPSPRD